MRQVCLKESLLALESLIAFHHPSDGPGLLSGRLILAFLMFLYQRRDGTIIVPVGYFLIPARFSLLRELGVELFSTDPKIVYL
jgi:hypothetical protein